MRKHLFEMKQSVSNVMATTTNVPLLLLMLGLWIMTRVDSSPSLHSLSRHYEVPRKIEIWVDNQRRKAREKCTEYMKYACRSKTSFNEKYFDKDRVLNGEYVPEGMLPHMAFLLITINEIGVEEITRCAGTLISDKFIMTAAHCTCDYVRIQVKLGSLHSTNDGTGQWFNPSDIYIHPSYTCHSLQNDIALLKLPKKVEFNTHVRPICLNINYKGEYNHITVSGWGRTEDGNYPEHLKITEVKVRGKPLLSACRNFLGDDSTHKNQTICAGDTLENKDTCVGDSGGPLQIPMSNGCPNTYEQLGITSFGEGDCRLDTNISKIGIYSKVAYHVPWIANIVWPDHHSKNRNYEQSISYQKKTCP